MTTRNKRRFRCAPMQLMCVALMAVLVAPVAAQQAQPLPQTQPLKVGLMRIMGLAPIYSGIDQGYFKDEGVDLQLTAMRGGSVILPAISGGSLNIGFSNVISAFIARDQGFDFVAIAGISYENRQPDATSPLGYKGTSALMVPNDSPIKSPKDLEGKTVAINTLRNIVWLSIVEMIKQKGADPSKVNWVEVPFPRMAAPLKMKQVDAIFQVQPLVVIYQDRHNLRILDYPFSAISDTSIPISFWVAREPWVKANKGLLNRFRKAQKKSIEYINAHPEERKRVVIKHFKMKPGLINRVAWNTWKAELDVRGLQWMSDLALKWNLLSKKLDVRTMIAP